MREEEEEKEEKRKKEEEELPGLVRACTKEMKREKDRTRTESLLFESIGLIYMFVLVN